MDMKKILLFGATGQTGRSLLQQALEKGHQVTAVARSPEKLEEFLKYEKFQVKEGDALKKETFEDEISNCDVVMSCLGSTSWSRFSSLTFFSDSMKQIHQAMNKKGVSRFIGMSSWATQDDPNLPFFVRWVLRPLIIKPVLDSLYKMEEYIKTTELNYTVVRPGGLSNEEATGKEVTVIDDAQFVPGCASMIARADVARFMLSCLQAEKHDRKIVAIGIKK